MVVHTHINTHTHTHASYTHSRTLHTGTLENTQQHAHFTPSAQSFEPLDLHREQLQYGELRWLYSSPERTN